METFKVGKKEYNAQWIELKYKNPKSIKGRIKLIDGSEINVLQQPDGDFWSELLQLCISQHRVTHYIDLQELTYTNYFKDEI